MCFLNCIGDLERRPWREQQGQGMGRQQMGSPVTKCSSWLAMPACFLNNQLLGDQHFGMAFLSVCNNSIERKNKIKQRACMNHAIIAERMVQTMVLDNVTVRTKTFTQYNSPNCSIVLFWVFFYFELSKKKKIQKMKDLKTFILRSFQNVLHVTHVY